MCDVIASSVVGDGCAAKTRAIEAIVAQIATQQRRSADFTDFRRLKRLRYKIDTENHINL